MTVLSLAFLDSGKELDFEIEPKTDYLCIIDFIGVVNPSYKIRILEGTLLIKIQCKMTFVKYVMFPVQLNS